jgi:hypothetical protein
MALINRLCAGFVLLTALSSFVVAHKSTPSPSSCNSNEFWWKNNFDQDKSCCLPKSPPHPLPSPPGKSQCPKPGDNHSWYYHSGNDGCVPTIPTPPPPQCPSDCFLTPHNNKCHPRSRPPQPKPSGSFKRRSELKARAVPTLCPMGLDVCPIPGLTSSDYECVDTKADLESCGGCVSAGEGQDCSEIEGAWNVGCEKGACIIYSCAAGYRRAYDGKSCIAH